MIRISPIRLIDENDEMIGVVETSDALKRAEEADLDLVEISPESRPPVCKIMDHGKFKYEQSKKDQRNRAASKQAEMKEVRLGRSIKIDPHDVGIRIDRARKFLLDGHKVLIVQQYRGREMQHRNLGRDLLDGVVEQLSDIGKVETPPRQMGRRVSMIIGPDKNKILLYKRNLEREQAAQEKTDAAASTTSKSEPTANKPVAVASSPVDETPAATPASPAENAVSASD